MGLTRQYLKKTTGWTELGSVTQGRVYGWIRTLIGLLILYM